MSEHRHSASLQSDIKDIMSSYRTTDSMKVQTGATLLQTRVKEVLHQSSKAVVRMGKLDSHMEMRE